MSRAETTPQPWLRTLLAFDVSGPIADIALFVRGARHIVTRRLALPRRNGRRAVGGGHSEHLIATLGAALAEGGLGFGAVDAVLTTRGPGGFSGVRVGLATARGLGTGLECAVETLLNTAATATAFHGDPDGAQACGRPSSAAVLLDVGRGMVAIQGARADAGAPIPHGFPATPLCVLIGEAQAVLDDLLGDDDAPLLLADRRFIDAPSQRAFGRRAHIVVAHACLWARPYALGAHGESILDPFYARPPDAVPSKTSRA